MGNYLRHTTAYEAKAHIFTARDIAVFFGWDKIPDGASVRPFIWQTPLQHTPFPQLLSGFRHETR